MMNTNKITMFSMFFTFMLYKCIIICAFSFISNCCKKPHSSFIFPFNINLLLRTKRHWIPSLLHMLKLPPSCNNSNLNIETSDESISHHSSNYEPSMEYPGTMRPGLVRENQPYSNLPLAGGDPLFIPWPHFQRIEWYHDWYPTSHYSPPIEEIIGRLDHWESISIEEKMLDIPSRSNSLKYKRDNSRKINEHEDSSNLDENDDDSWTKIFFEKNFDSTIKKNTSSNTSTMDGVTTWSRFPKVKSQPNDFIFYEDHDGKTYYSDGNSSILPTYFDRIREYNDIINNSANKSLPQIKVEKDSNSGENFPSEIDSNHFHDNGLIFEDFYLDYKDENFVTDVSQDDVEIFKEENDFKIDKWKTNRVVSDKNNLRNEEINFDMRFPEFDHNDFS